MTVVEIIKRIQIWLEDTVCQQIKLKMPNDAQMTEEYNVKLINPSALAFFVPAKDKLPPNIQSSIPSVVVQLVKGQDNKNNNSREIKIRLGFSAWNPGQHAKDVLNSKDNEEPKAFIRNADGWVDVWNFVDVALKELENTEHINGIKISRNDNIEYGPFESDGVLIETYPNWFAYITFSVETGLTKNDKESSQFL